MVAIIVFVAFLESGASILSRMPSILLLKSWRRVKKVRKQHLSSNQCSGSGSYVLGLLDPDPAPDPSIIKRK